MREFFRLASLSPTRSGTHSGLYATTNNDVAPGQPPRREKRHCYVSLIKTGTPGFAGDSRRFDRCHSRFMQRMLVPSSLKRGRARGEMRNSQRMGCAHRTTLACKPMCALQVGASLRIRWPQARTPMALGGPRPAPHPVPTFPFAEGEGIVLCRPRWLLSAPLMRSPNKPPALPAVI